jgi:rhodanese-related sulfurtransferase
LIFAFWLPGAVLIANSLFLVFFATLIFNAARGLDIDCGCFSVSTASSSGGYMLWYLLRDGFFLFVGLCLFYVAFFWSREKFMTEKAITRVSKPSQTRRVAIGETIGIMLIAVTLGLIVNQLRSDRLPLIADWSPEARLTLKLGNKILIPLNEASDKFFSGAAVFIDARPSEEYREEHIRGARNLPIGAFDEKAGEVLIDLPENTLIITYCDGEKCNLSVELAQKLKQIGFENVRVLFNGWTVWKEHHLPTQAEPSRRS